MTFFFADFINTLVYTPEVERSAIVVGHSLYIREFVKVRAHE